MQRLEAQQGGFTLVELVVALVVVGILTAVAIIGMTGVTHAGDKSACSVTMSAALTASAAYYTKAGTYPQTFTDLTNPPSGRPLLEPNGRVTETATTLTGPHGWVLTLHPGATTADKTWFDGC